MTMYVRSGVDLVEIERFARLKPAILRRFIHRVLTPAEQAEIGESISKLAGKFAAKEAAVKALGCGIGKVHWTDLEILHDAYGQPELHFHGAAEDISSQLGISQKSVSISHTQSLAIAVVMFLGSG